MIIESKNIVINLDHCMINATGHYLNEDVIRAITHQASELLPFTKHLAKWVSENELVKLVNSLDEEADQAKRLKSSRVNRHVKEESRKVYASPDKHFSSDNLIELGYKNEQPINEVVTQKELIQNLKDRAASWAANIKDKELILAAVYKLALLNNRNYHIANSLGMVNK